MKKVLFFVVMLVGAVALASCSSNEQFDLDVETEFVVGLEAAYAPFNWSTSVENEFSVPLAGQPGVFVDGYDVVVSSMIADELGLDLVIKANDWDGLIPALLSGEIDMIIAGMSPTAERAETVAFSDEYFRSEQVVVVSTGGAYAHATSLADFNGARVVAQLGTLQDDLIDQITGVNHLDPLDTYALLATAVAQNAADAFIAELPVAQGMVATNSNLTIIRFTGENGFTVSDEDVIVSVALRQEDVNLLAAVNEALAGISTDTRNQIMAEALERQDNAS
ncbi:MAG TPA: transporter substrate-binding domain-containing protein [Acholeplasmataceae bacterium]|nr:transporter substrate-binding domain-containing protein [Acholeplasmataceae bacterium]